MNKEERAIVKLLDDSSLYAAPSIVEKLFSYQDSDTTELFVRYDDNGVINGYIPNSYQPLVDEY